MQKFINSIIVLLTSHLCITAFAQSNTPKYSPYGIELTVKKSVSNYYENEESLLPDEWEQIGPNGFSGYSIAVDPQNENIIYAGGFSGLYKTIDGGANWELVSSSTINNGIIDIAINPANPNILLSWFQNNNIYHATKLMRSTNSGDTWTEVLNGSGIRGNVIFDPQNNQRVFAYSTGDSLYLSTNGGINWDAISSFGFVNAFTIFPQSSNILYAVSNLYLYKSTNAGVTWELSNPQLPISFTSVKVSQTSSDIIFAGNENFEGDGGFYRSTDGGDYWLHLTNGFGRSKSVSKIALDPENQNIIYAGGYANGIFRSDDMGGQWINISESIQDNFILAITTTTNNKIYCAFGGGIYYSVNQGSTWQSLTGNLQNCDVFKVVSHPINPGIVYASSLGGVYRSYNGGIDWQLINNGLLDTDVFALTIDPINPSTLYAGTFGNLIYKSTDAGDTWIEKSNGLPGLGQARIWELTCHPNEPSWIWTGDYQVYQSTDSGENWTEFLIASERVDNMVYAPGNPDIIYAFSAISGSKLYRTTNRGSTWEVRNTFQSIDQLAIDPNNSDILYASSFNIGEVVKSNDGGLTWDVSVLYFSYQRNFSKSPTFKLRICGYLGGRCTTINGWWYHLA